MWLVPIPLSYRTGKLTAPTRGIVYSGSDVALSDVDVDVLLLMSGRFSSRPGGSVVFRSCREVPTTAERPAFAAPSAEIGLS